MHLIIIFIDSSICQYVVTGSQCIPHKSYGPWTCVYIEGFLIANIDYTEFSYPSTDSHYTSQKLWPLDMHVFREGVFNLRY